MRFRTEIEPIKSTVSISHATPLLMLGSCFTDEIGGRLEADGFDVLHNPFGALYNPLSISNCLRRALSDEAYTTADLTVGPRGFHCLDYAMRFSGAEAQGVIDGIEDCRRSVAGMLRRRPVVILTFGTSFVFERADSGSVVGNCHKFPPSFFNRRRLSVDECTDAVLGIAAMLAPVASAVLLTVSPIRHTADGLHGNNLSKATLLLACDSAVASSSCVEYFPAYEALVDDLRDYRFYAADMKHPSEVAADYIYELFSDTFFDSGTKARALQCRREFMASRHRSIL